MYASRRSETSCRNDSIDECFICHGLSSLFQTAIRSTRDKHNKMIRTQPNQAIVVEFLSHFSNNLLLLSVSLFSMRYNPIKFPVTFCVCVCVGNRFLPMSSIENGKRRKKKEKNYYSSKKFQIFHQKRFSHWNFCPPWFRFVKANTI